MVYSGAWICSTAWPTSPLARWTALAAWLAVMVGVAALLYALAPAASESREEVLRSEINRMRSAADELRDRYRAQYNAPVNNEAFQEAHTQIINGRHRRDLV